MKPQKGYYSVIQYCPDLGRFEGANIGVLLLCPESEFLEAKIAQNNRRAKRFFGSEGHDWKRLSAIKKSLLDRLEQERGSLRTVAELQHFTASRANMIQLTPPKPIKVIEPSVELKALFETLVGEEKTKERKFDFAKSLAKKLKSAGLERKLREDLKVHVPAFDSIMDVPFGFQNGRFNLITPVEFDVGHLRAKASTCAIEGRSLYQHRDENLGELQLVVVGKFDPGNKDSHEIVNRVLAENNVKLVAAGQIQKLIEEIRRTGKDLEHCVL